MNQSVSDANFGDLFAAALTFALVNDIDIRDKDVFESIFSMGIHSVSDYYRRKRKNFDPTADLISKDAIMHAFISMQDIYDSEMDKISGK